LFCIKLAKKAFPILPQPRIPSFIACDYVVFEV
jgi:hypothetical protein